MINAGDDCVGFPISACSNEGVGGGLHYVGPGQGCYAAESTYRYVGRGGDFSNVRRRRDFTCLLIMALLSLLLLLSALAWWFWPTDECFTEQAEWQYKWGRAKQARCCARVGVGCQTLQATAQPAPGPVDPFNCGLGFLNWKAGWSQTKKQWCCRVHKKGCPAPGEGWGAIAAAQYDCNAGIENWVKGWSTLKKTWCCNTQRKGCIGSGALNVVQAAAQGFGAGAQYGDHGAPVAAIRR